MTKGPDDGFEVRIGTIRSPSGERRVRGFFRRVSAKASPSRRMGRSGQRRTLSSSSFQRRVLIKLSITKLASGGVARQRAHLRYIARDGAALEIADGSDRGELFDAENDSADGGAFFERRQDDRHHFRLIVAPEDGGELADLRAYTRDLAARMEADLGTKLDWVAADHYDTGQPHVHMVVGGKREDGRDLVMPRRYVSHGIREQAQDLVALELGPVSEIAGRARLARMLDQERLTDLDRRLIGQSREGIVDLSAPARAGQAWRRRLDRQRLATLSRFGLAEPQGSGRWRLGDDAENVLRRMGERGDVVKAMHRAMGRMGRGASVPSADRYDAEAPSAEPITGKIVGLGVTDDVADRAYLIVDRTDGLTSYVDVGGAYHIEGFRDGLVVTVGPNRAGPRPADRTIAAIARKNGGRYAPSLHVEDDPKASPDFVEAHVRRLEALRRKGHADRLVDGSWTVPPDFLDRAGEFERVASRGRPVVIEARSTIPFERMATATGVTWLDEELRDHGDTGGRTGFGAEVEDARKARRAFLVREGLIERDRQRLSEDVLDRLRARDLASAGKMLGRELGKPYAPATDGRIDGVFRRIVDRPSGRFAVVERSKDFTLVPWRPIMDRRLGRSISGVSSSQRISWNMGRGPSR